MTFEGPGGRSPLTQLDAAPGSRQPRPVAGWRSGGFTGAQRERAQRRQPDALQRQGRRASTTKARSPGIARASRPPTAGTYALDFQSANYLATVWVDGHASWARTGLLPAVRRARHARRRQRTRSSCASTGETPPSRHAKGFTARGSTGAGSTARWTCARSAKANCPNRRPDDAPAGHAERRPGDGHGRACKCATTATAARSRRRLARARHARRSR